MNNFVVAVWFIIVNRDMHTLSLSQSLSVCLSVPLPNSLPPSLSLSIYIWKKLKDRVIQSDEFIVKESRRFNVFFLINHHQGFKIYDIMGR